MDDFIKRVPKVELHIHIEGTLMPSMRWSLSKRNGVTLPQKSEEELVLSYEQLYNNRTVHAAATVHMSFFEAYYGGMDVLITSQDFYELAIAYFEKCKEMNVRYTEPFFDPQAHTRRGVELETVMSGLRRAQVEAEERLGIKSQWIMCFLRDMTPEEAMETYKSALAYRSMIVAVGLDSDETD